MFRSLFFSLSCLCAVVFVVGCSQQSLSPVSIPADNTTTYDVVFAPDTSLSPDEGRLKAICLLSPKLAKSKTIPVPVAADYVYLLYGAETRTDTLTLSGSTIDVDLTGLKPGSYGFALYTVAVDHHGDSVRVTYGDTESDAFQITAGGATTLTLSCAEMFHPVKVTLPATIPTEISSATLIMRSYSTFPTDSETVAITNHSVPVELGVPLNIAGTSQKTFSYSATLNLRNASGDLIYYGQKDCTIDIRINNTFSMTVKRVASEVGAVSFDVSLVQNANSATFSVTYEE